MAVLEWDKSGERTYETGVDRGVLYIPDASGAYPNGVAWNGLVNVTESPSGAESNPQYADNQKYLNLISAEEFSATLEAFTYPEEFEQFDGLGSPETGVTIGQQARGVFGLSYRTLVGNDIEGDAYGEKMHLVYGAQASPSEKAYGTVSDSPEAITFSWELTTTPVPVTGFKATSVLTVDSTRVDAAAYSTLQDFLWGTAGTDPSLPLPDDVIALFSGTVTEVTPQAPTAVGNDVTIPAQTGVEYYDGATLLSDGVYTITEDVVIVARPAQGYKFPAVVEDEWFFAYT